MDDEHPQIPMWHTNHSLPKNTLLAIVHFHDHIASSVQSASVGTIALRAHNASADAVTLMLQPGHASLSLSIDFSQLKSEIRPTVASLYAITLQLDHRLLRVHFVSQSTPRVLRFSC